MNIGHETRDCPAVKKAAMPAMRRQFEKNFSLSKSGSSWI